MDLPTRTQSVFGVPTSKGQLYGGLYLLAGGVALGLLSLLLFFFAAGREGTAYFGWREAALATGAVALTCFFVGISVALPSKLGMRIASFVGMVLCAVAIVLFVIHYPKHFNVGDTPSAGADYTGIDVGIFALGLAAIVAGAFTSVIGYYVQRITEARAASDVEDAFGDDYEIPDWVIERDLADAMSRHGVDWGRGFASSENDVMEINLGTSYEEAGMVHAGKVRRVQVAATEVEAGEQGLRSLNQEEAELPGEWADEGAAALAAFRKQQAARPEQFRPRVAWYLRFWDWLRGRRTQ